MRLFKLNRMLRHQRLCLSESSMHFKWFALRRIQSLRRRQRRANIVQRQRFTLSMLLISSSNIQQFSIGKQQFPRKILFGGWLTLQNTTFQNSTITVTLVPLHSSCWLLHWVLFCLVSFHFFFRVTYLHSIRCSPFYRQHFGFALSNVVSFPTDAGTSSTTGFHSLPNKYVDCKMKFYLIRLITVLTY